MRKANQNAAKQATGPAMGTVAESGEAKSYWATMVELNQRRAKLGAKFNRMFSTSIQNFWDVTTGFDIIKFDEWLKTPDGKSTREWILETKGEEHVQLIEALLAGT